MADSDAHSTGPDDDPPVEQAISPFDNPNADLIIRTSDLVEFHVFTVILKEASPVFADMLSLPQADADSRTASTGTVEVTEDSDVWDLVLCICYTRKFTITTELMWPLLEVAKKYDMVGVQEAVRQRLLEVVLLSEDNLRAYLLACHYGFPDIARTAARNNLNHPASTDEEFVPELRYVTSATYFRWVQYRRECVKAATSFAHDYDVFSRNGWRGHIDRWGMQAHAQRSSGQGGQNSGCTSCRPSVTRYAALFVGRYVRRALQDFMAQTEDALRERPHGDTVCNYKLVATLTQAVCECTTCNSRMGHNDIGRFVEFYATQVDDAVGKVCCREFDE